MLDERSSGTKIDTDIAVVYMSSGGQQMVQALLGDACGDPELELREFRERYANRQTPTEALFAGVASGLQELHAAGHRLAVCSNKPHKLCNKVLDDTRLSHLFEIVVGGQAGMRPKPAPDLMKAVLDALGDPNDNCIYIGDSEIDDAVARNAGLAFCFMTYGYGKPERISPDARSFDHFGLLVDALLAHPEALT